MLRFSAWLCGLLAGLAFLLPATAQPGRPPTLFLVGDSTMANKPVIPPNAERGWGQMLPAFFTEAIRIENHAVNGRSSKSFLSEGRWAAITNRLQPGDWVIIQFGHNDEKTTDPKRFTEPFGSFQTNLTRYILEARTHGAHPLLATPVVRRAFEAAGKLKDTHGDYVPAVRQVAAAQQVPLLELNSDSATIVQALGPERSKKLYLWVGPDEFPNLKAPKEDDTHFCAYGATRMCDLAVAEIQKVAPELAQYLNQGQPQSTPAKAVKAPATGAAKVLTNIEYGVAAGVSLRLDVAVPPGNQTSPVALLVHGGGWSSGDKQDILWKTVEPLLSSNFVCFSINYRLAPTNPWPACFEDLQTAIRWVKAHARDYRGDPERIALVGYSAGGHLVSLAAVQASQDTRVQAVVGFAPPTDLVADCERRGGVSSSLQQLFSLPPALNEQARARLHELSPINHLKADLPPFFLLHGTEDKSVPYSQSVNLQAKLRELKVPCELITLPGAPHNLSKWPQSGVDYQQPLLHWLATNLCDSSSAPAHTSVSHPTNLFVAADGTGAFKTVQEAIMAVPAGSPETPVFIHIKPGVYRELIYVQRERRFFHLLGEDAAHTVLTYDLNAKMPGPDGKSIGTFRTPSTVIDADDFTAENLTFENSAGPVGQALAIRIEGDRAVFRHCRFLSWQDTILANRGRQLFSGCYICGHVDFIFGGATAFFENCHIHCLRDGYITAASTPDNQPFGFVFSHCQITGEPGVHTYLGRPWRLYASTAFLKTEMDEVVRPEGWHNWNKPEAETTSRYAEYGSTGAGAHLQKRVPWARQFTSEQAKEYTRENVLRGQDNWQP